MNIARELNDGVLRFDVYPDSLLTPDAFIDTLRSSLDNYVHQLVTQRPPLAVPMQVRIHAATKHHPFSIDASDTLYDDYVQMCRTITELFSDLLVSAGEDWARSHSGTCFVITELCTFCNKANLNPAWDDEVLPYSISYNAELVPKIEFNIDGDRTGFLHRGVMEHRDRCLQIYSRYQELLSAYLSYRNFLTYPA